MYHTSDDIEINIGLIDQHNPFQRVVWNFLVQLDLKHHNIINHLGVDILVLPLLIILYTDLIIHITGIDSINKDALLPLIVRFSSLSFFGQSIQLRPILLLTGLACLERVQITTCLSPRR